LLFLKKLKIKFKFLILIRKTPILTKLYYENTNHCFYVILSYYLILFLSIYMSYIVYHFMVDKYFHEYNYIILLTFLPVLGILYRINNNNRFNFVRRMSIVIYMHLLPSNSNNVTRDVAYVSNNRRICHCKVFNFR